MARQGLAAFLRNDVEHAPFGVDALRGVTPARFAVFALLALTPVIANLDGALMRFGISSRLGPIVFKGWLFNLQAALPLFVAIVWAERKTKDASTAVRVAAFTAAVLAGAAAYSATFVGYAVLAGASWRDWPVYPMIPVHFYKATMAGAMACAVLYFMARERTARAGLERARLARIATQRQIAEARLQLLNAQIEPHFLFNSLASVKRLYEQERGGGRNLLRNIGTYIRSAVDVGKLKESTVAREVAMAREFLEIVGLRMGERLRLSVQVAPDVQDAVVPPLMLGTLVENAVKHGIGPRASGGEVRIEARAVDGNLLVAVSDDGVGFSAESGTGVGLANTRARLASLYGREGTLELERNPRGGVTATILVPLRRDQRAEPIESVDTREMAPARSEPRRRGYFKRAWHILTWKHWAWAISLGTSIAMLDRLRTWATPFDLFGPFWLFETFYDVACACIFMLAIVLTEASRSTRQAPGWLYGFGAAIATVICLGYLAVSPMKITPDTVAKFAKGTPEQQAIIRSLVSHPRIGLAQLSGIGMVAVIHGLLGTAIYVWFRSAGQAAAALAEAQAASAEAERRLVQSRLEAVEAEVDPAFVFTTLEAVEKAYDRDRAAADAMLDELIAFLRAAIPKVRVEAPDESATAVAG